MPNTATATIIPASVTLESERLIGALAKIEHVIDVLRCSMGEGKLVDVLIEAVAVIRNDAYRTETDDLVDDPVEEAADEEIASRAYHRTQSWVEMSDARWAYTRMEEDACGSARLRR